MRKKILVTLTATATAVSMMVAPCLTVFAEDMEHASAGAGQTVEADNVVATDGHSAVTAEGEGATVNVSGEVKESGTYTNPSGQEVASTAVYVNNGGAVNVGGDVTSTDGGGAANVTGDNSSVEIKGNVNASGQTTRVEDRTVNSGVTVHTEDTTGSTAIQSYNGSNVTVGGNINAGDGAGAVYASSNSNVNIKGDINSSGQGTLKYEESENKTEANAVSVYSGSSVTVNGNITTEGGGTAVYAYGKDTAVKADGNVSVSGVGVSKGSDGHSTELDYSAVQAYSGSKVEVKGDVTKKDGGTAVKASGSSDNGASVSVGGNVDASGTRKETDKDGNVKLIGARGVVVNEGGTATVGGNVTGASYGISANADSTVDVGGSVKATGVESTTYKWNDETKKYDIPETSVLGQGIATDGDGKLKVGSNVQGVTNGILVNPDNDNKAGTIVVGDTVSASGKGGVGIQIFTKGASYGGLDYKDLNDYLDDVPTIVVGGIDANIPVGASATIEGKTEKESSSEIQKAIIESINYIIKVDEESKSKYGVSVSGENVKKIEGYDTVNIEKAFNVAASIPQGYRLEGGENVKVTQNSDGTYTLILTNVKGGINVKAVLIPVPKEETGETEYVVVAEGSTSSQSSEPSQPSTVPAGAIVATSTPAPAAGAAPSAISGTKPANTVTIDLGKVTPTQYQAAVIQNVAQAPANGAFNIETDRVSFLDTKMIEAIAARPDIDVNVVFTYNGRRIKVTIPAGFNVRTLLDSNGYCGFLRLLSILGGTDIK